MTTLRLGAASLNQVPLDWKGNTERILAAITEAQRQRVGILCLPELCITGYGCEDAFLAPYVQQRALNELCSIAAASLGIVVAVGLPLLVDGKLYDVAALLVDGKIAGFVGKQNLAGDGIHYEPRWFRPWRRGYTTEISVAGTSIPVGDLLFEIDNIRVGFEICEDAWVNDRPGSYLQSQGAQLILNPSASHFAFGKYEVRKRLVLDGAAKFGVVYVYSNLVGNEAGRALYDGCLLIAQNEKLLVSGERFSYRDVNLCSCVVTVENPTNQPRESSVENTVSRLQRCRMVLPTTEPGVSASALPSWELSGSIKEEEFTRAVALGLFDYLRKSRSCGFVVSLSGGADSAAVSVLVSLMVKLGLQSLGRDGFLQKLSYIHSLCAAPVSDPAHALVKQLLCCVYQATKNSTEMTRNAAQTISQAISAQYLEFQVQDLVDSYQQRIEAALGLHLSWNEHDIALQNIQARVRAPSVWMIANLKNALLLATSNRSEAAVGYTTMDGDTCGGLSPLAGIDKAFLRRWLKWMELEGPVGLGSLPELSVVTSQKPTAELRPPEYGQRDEDDLMPYDILDAIERYAIRDKKGPREVQELLVKAYPEVASAQLQIWVDRFFQLWARNQWKRERYAPCFHLDDENLDPKTWCRWPILSGENG